MCSIRDILVETDGESNRAVTLDDDGSAVLARTSELEDI